MRDRLARLPPLLWFLVTVTIGLGLYGPVRAGLAEWAARMPPGGLPADEVSTLAGAIVGAVVWCGLAAVWAAGTGEEAPPRRAGDSHP